MDSFLILQRLSTKTFSINYEYFADVGLDLVRHYFFQDLQQTPPRWVAHLQLFAAAEEVLASVRFEDISVEHVYIAIAHGAEHGGCIYHYRWSQPKIAYNTIYDEMPMEGWWPWPRADTVLNSERLDEERLAEEYRGRSLTGYLISFFSGLRFVLSGC
ncbi:uncharacterized protein F4822DRAFT_408240 [Hypoxylon trugodes]|uniref:uncharacterized protein n=1 Tax=Hypoxylon trugodes TaxID=326681 RepID=UPI002191FEFB|nr:uncharacterized protein F4822DRAFT_408240 [Hypoxylon trugodes]KAI1387982.1 hypothetical protein F4822DRAFT_408240 [Hypoxylon trugodes]